MVAALGAGAVFGLVGNAGAASGQATAVSHVTGAPTASFKFSVSVRGLTPSAVTITGSGQADAATDAASLTVQLPAAVAKLLPGGKAAPEVVKAELVSHTVYLNVPGLSALVGKPWIAVSIPAADNSQVSGIFSKVASALGDVNSIVALAHSHHATVTSLGTSTVDGVTATGHKIVTTLAHGKADVTADLWADTADRLVQADAKVAVTTKKHHADIERGPRPQQVRRPGDHRRPTPVAGEGGPAVHGGVVPGQGPAPRSGVGRPAHLARNVRRCC